VKDWIITLDGPAGSGKSTIARRLAAHLGLAYADSGAIYRTFTLALIQKLGTADSAEQFGELLEKSGIEPHSLAVSILTEASVQRNRIAGVDQLDRIRTPDVTARIRYIADRREYRMAVNELLSGMKGLVADGRDMGSVVFPHAPFKFYLEASVDVRATRRHQEQADKGYNEDLGAIRAAIQKRDNEDKNRAWGALVRTDDMILIDTGPLDPDGVLRRILNSLQIQF